MWPQARDWHAYMRGGWSEGHAVKVLALLENDLFPYMGGRLLAEITAPELLTQARRIEARGAVETAYRVIRAVGAVFRFGVQHGLCESDPSRDPKGAIRLPVAKHRPAMTDPSKLEEPLRAMDDYQGTPIARAALALRRIREGWRAPRRGCGHREGVSVRRAVPADGPRRRTGRAVRRSRVPPVKAGRPTPSEWAR